MATCGHDVSGPLRGPQFDVVLQAGGGEGGGGGGRCTRGHLAFRMTPGVSVKAERMSSVIHVFRAIALDYHRRLASENAR